MDCRSGFRSFCCGLALAGFAVSASTSTAEPTATNAPTTVTFTKNIAPIIYNRCTGCHRPEQPGPFNLITYEDVKKRAQQIADIVANHYMPPWPPEAGHAEFVGARTVPPDEIELLQEWVKAGAPEGEPADLPPLPPANNGWKLGKPDLVVQMPFSYTVPAAGKDVYRNFVFPIPVNARKYVRGVDFNPGNPTVIHHAFIEVDPTRYSRLLAEKQTPPGFDGMELPETATMPSGQFLGWQPGKAPTFIPKGLAWELPTNTDLVLQLHMHPSGKPEAVQPTIAFYFTEDAPTNSAFRINLNPLLIDIPAGARDYAIEDTYALPIDVDLIGIAPHAHYLGKQLRGTAVFPDGNLLDLLVIQNWDFNWQGDYQYAKPIFLPKGTRLMMHFSYDNSAENVRNPNQPPKRVKYGLQTTDEMGELWLQVVPRKPAELKVLAKDFYLHLLGNTLAYNDQVVKENPNDAEAYTRAGRARHYLGQFSQALADFNAAIRANPAYDRAYYELGFMELRLNQLNEAQKAFEKVIRLNPKDYEAQGNLGLICLQRRDFVGARQHFEEALRINPQDPVSRGYLEQLKSAPL